jgi:hypothetical protein
LPVVPGGPGSNLHVDHIQPRREGGTTDLANLALACVSCSLRKGGSSETRDPETGSTVRLFHPRVDRWDEHFQLDDDFHIVGVSSIGRATVERSSMNRPLAIAIRHEEALRGRYP